MSRPHLSVSALGTLQRCGYQYYFRYIKGIKSPPGVALIIGKGTHAAVESDLGNVLETGSLLPDDAIADFAADATKAAWDAEEPMRGDDEPDRDGAVDAAVSLAQLHHKEVAPAIEPVAIERGFLLELDGFPFDIKGYIDIEEPTRIRDTKTSSKAPPANAAAVSDQLTCYALSAHTRGETKTVALDYLVKTKVAKAITLESQRTADDYARFLRRMETAAEVIQSGSFLPAPADSWACSAKFCGYWENHCEFGARGRTRPIPLDRLRSRLLPPRRAAWPPLFKEGR